MTEYHKLLEQNRKWAADMRRNHPEFFQQFKEQQKPKHLLIGCSDSRVNPSTITGTQLGEIFMHRNIANLVVHTDFNLLSVLQYAVEELKVEHIIVCGHYDCGGVKHALSRRSRSFIDKWVRSIKDVYRLYKAELEAIEDKEQQLRRLVELNIIEQVWNLAKSSAVQFSWAKDHRPILHGWVYELQTGDITELTTILPNQIPEDIYNFEFPEELQDK